MERPTNKLIDNSTLNIQSGLAVIAILIFVSMLMVGCSSGGGDAAKVVEDYYLALTEENIDQMKSLSCAAWEENAQLEFDAFAGVQTELNNLECKVIDTQEELTMVECTGGILATYGNEQQDFDLGDVTYQVVKEAGEWRMCGY